MSTSSRYHSVGVMSYDYRDIWPKERVLDVFGSMELGQVNRDEYSDWDTMTWGTDYALTRLRGNANTDQEIYSPSRFIGNIVARLHGVRNVWTRRCVYWKRVPTVADVDILARWGWNNHNAVADEPDSARIYARAGGSVGTETGYFVGFKHTNNLWTRANDGGTKVGLYKYDNGVLSTFFEAGYPWTHDQSTSYANCMYWVRFRVIGSTIMFRVWRDWEDEPTSWMFSTTDPSPLGAGKVGIGFYAPSGTSGTGGGHDWDLFSVATDGERADGPRSKYWIPSIYEPA